MSSPGWRSSLPRSGRKTPRWKRRLTKPTTLSIFRIWRAISWAMSPRAKRIFTTSATELLQRNGLRRFVVFLFPPRREKKGPLPKGSGQSGWDIGKLPMFMIQDLSEKCNRNLCRKSALIREARRAIPLLSKHTKITFLRRLLLAKPLFRVIIHKSEEGVGRLPFCFPRKGKIGKEHPL